jgi:hypothetical protein
LHFSELVGHSSASPIAVDLLQADYVGIANYIDATPHVVFVVGTK